MEAIATRRACRKGHGCKSGPRQLYEGTPCGYVPLRECALRTTSVQREIAPHKTYWNVKMNKINGGHAQFRDGSGFGLYNL
jgi:hypothetical protein